MTYSILLIDREVSVLRELGGRLEAGGWEVARELEPAAAVAAAARLDPDLAVLDGGMPPLEGAPLLDHLARLGIPVIAVLESADSGAAAAAYRAGAVQVLSRPADPEVLAAAAERVARAARWQHLCARADATPAGARLQALGGHPPMRGVAQQIASLAQSDRSAVLLVGEPGTGKAAAARLLHDLSPRAGEPFVVVDAARSDGDGSLEADIFGREPGAGMGRPRRRRGALERAGEGTVLLREVAAVPPELHPPLLRVLESRVARRMGGDRDMPVRARLVATTSRDLAAEVEAGRFHGDLQYRLATAVVGLPPVRERAEADRRALLAAVYAEVGGRWGAPAPALSDEAMERLASYPWPGNIVEIRHVLDRAALLARGQPAVLVEHLAGELRARPGLGDRRHQPMSLEDVERRQIESSLRFHGGNRTRAARELRISRATLINKIKRYGLTE